MVELNMIDTMGFGIFRMFSLQSKRSFPLPDYDLSDPDAVRLTLYGSVIDPAYTTVLLEKTDLPLDDVLALDRVQKRLHIDETHARRLRKAGLVEGRRPNLRVSAQGVQSPKERVEYILNRGQDDEFYEKLILDFIARFSHATRRDIDTLLLSKLSDSLTAEQKQNKISNLLTSMRRRRLIENTGARKTPKWQIPGSTAPSL